MQVTLNEDGVEVEGPKQYQVPLTLEQIEIVLEAMDEYGQALADLGVNMDLFTEAEQALNSVYNNHG